MIDIKLTSYGSQYIKVSNNGGKNSNKTFYFLQRYGKFLRVSFGDETYGMNGSNAIKFDEVTKFIDCAKAAGLVAAF